MKSFFKKLSLVLVLAMVVTIVPMNVTKAADIAVTVGTAKDEVFTEKTLEIGEKITGIKFYGPKGYYKAGDVVTWTSSNTAVATAGADDTVGAKVYDGKVVAVAAGTATITVTTDRGVVGSFKVTVPAAAVTEPEVTEPAVTEPEGIAVKQYRADKIAIEFATAAEATAAKKDVVVKRVRTTARNTTKYTAFSTTAATDGNVLYVTGQFANGYEYQISATGIPATVFTAKWGTPAYAEIDYSDAVMTGDSRIATITGATTMTFGTANPTIVVYDDSEEPVIVAVITGSTKPFQANNFTDIKATYTKVNGTMYATLLGAGAVQFRKIEDQFMTISSKVEWKATAASQFVAIPEQPDAITVYPVKYEDPDLGGYVWDMVLTNKDDAHINDIVWHTDDVLDGSDTLTASMKVGDAARLAAYFLGTDNKKYVANGSWFKSQTANNTAMFTEMGVNYARFAYVLSDDSPKNVVSVSTNGQVRALNNGTASIILWQLAENAATYVATNNNIPVGEIVITVAAKPVVDQIVLCDNNVFGYNNALNTKKTVEYYLIDQNGDRIAEPGSAALRWLVTDKANVRVTTRATATTNGVLEIDMNGAAVTTNPIEVTLTCGKAAKATLLYNVNAVNTNAETAGVSYTVKASDVVINTKTISATAGSDDAAKKSSKIEVVKLHDGVEMAAVNFSVTADTTADKGSLHTGTYFVVITDPNGNVVTRNVGAAADFATVTKNTNGEVTAVADTTEDDVFNLGCYAVANNAQTHATVGTYVVSLYEKQETNGEYYIVPTGAQATFEVSYGVNEITDVQNKTVKADNKGVTTSAAWTRTTATKAAQGTDPLTGEDAAWTEFAKEIVATLACSYDVDSDATTGNYRTIGSMATVEAVDYTVGANGEIYIISATVQYYIPGMKDDAGNSYSHTQTLDLGILFQTGGVVTGGVR